jgi:hypothetical protein
MMVVVGIGKAHGASEILIFVVGKVTELVAAPESE